MRDSQIPTDDIQLIQLIHQRDQNGLVLLYQKYGNLVYSLAVRVLREPSLAEEVTQDVFLKVWRYPDRWDATLGQFSSWLLTITRNAAIDRLRVERRKPSRIGVPVDDLELAATPTAFSDDPLWLNGQVLGKLLEQLPADQRQVIEMAFFQGFTHTELADEMSLPLGTVKTRLRLGLQKLRSMWAEAHSK